MNINALRTAAANDPTCRASTTRMKMFDGTLWYKDNDDSRATHYPLISFRDTYLVEWECRLLNWGYVNSRTSSSVRETRSYLKHKWEKRLGVPEEHYHSSPVPHVSLFGTSELRSEWHPYAVTKENLTAGITKTLMMGFNPSTVDADKMAENPDDYEARGFYRGDPSKINTQFSEGLLELVECLAYGAIKRENSLKDHSNLIVQLEATIETRMKEMEAVLADRATDYFAPRTDEKASGEKYLKQLVELSSRVRETAEKLVESTQQFNVKCNACESVYHDGRNMVYPLNRAHLRKQMSRNYRTDAHDQELSLSFGGVRLVDNNASSYSFYWLQRHIRKYINLLRDFGVTVQLPWDQPPEEWVIEDIASALFMTESS